MAAGQVYLVGLLEGCYKIGRSGDSEKRLLSYSPKLPVTLTIHHRISTDDAPWLESSLHAAFSHRRSGGEWFRLSAGEVKKVKALVAVSREGGLPRWVARLIGSHYPNGFEPTPGEEMVATIALPEVETAPPVVVDEADNCGQDSERQEEDEGEEYHDDGYYEAEAWWDGKDESRLVLRPGYLFG